MRLVSVRTTRRAWRSGAVLLALVMACAHGVARAAPLAAGGAHTCAVTDAGALRCWGGNVEGQLGDGTTVDRRVPVDVLGLQNGVTDVAAGALHTCALQNGRVFCFGNNDEGQLGNPGLGITPYPVEVLLSAGPFVGLSAGSYHTCALSSAGAAVCWGNNADGEIGIGTVSEGSVPMTPAGLGHDVVQISAGGNSTCAIVSDRSVRCWGFNAGGADFAFPTTVLGVRDAVQVSTGDGTVCVLTAQAEVLCWRLAGRVAPVDATPVAGFDAAPVSIDVSAHGCAVDHAGAALCWGDNSYGELGDGTTSTRAVAQVVSGLSQGVRAVAAGALHSCALLVAGDVYCWGFNGAGQLGTGDRVNRLTPARTLLDYVLTPKPVIEYYHAGLDRYFMTLLDAEIAALDDGALTGWSRTGLSFNAWPLAASGTSPVCRFYLPPAWGDSHFQSASQAECNDVRQKFPQFLLESADVMYIATPDTATGECPAPTVPVYRVWNGRADTDHRYTTDRNVRDAMIARGYVPEGYGPDGVVMCAEP